METNASDLMMGIGAATLLRCDALGRLRHTTTRGHLNYWHLQQHGSALAIPDAIVRDLAVVSAGSDPLKLTTVDDAWDRITAVGAEFGRAWRDITPLDAQMRRERRD